MAARLVPDPSDLIQAIILGDDGQLPYNLDPEEANAFAFDGGPTGTFEDAGDNINAGNLHDNGFGIDVPTGAKPSPLFGAAVFTQRMLLFEEFGPVPLGPEGSVVAGNPLPTPANAVSVPNSQSLENFLAQYVTPTQALPFPFPTVGANTTALNPWKTLIEAFLGRTLAAPPAEGRPPGQNWSHQRFTEFFPEVFVNTAQTGARTNLGLRNPLQRHHYSVGEFAPGGLYYNTVGPTPGGAQQPQFDGTTAGIPVRLHPNFPVQNPLSLWTFDGTFPPKLLLARYGEPILFRHYDALPVDPGANMGFGLHTLTTHEHNGHTPAESDGYTQSFFFPGKYYDYNWPMVLAGNDTINTAATDPKAGAPNGSGGITKVPGDWRETMSTHWFHDHMLDFTAQNVFKGNAAMMNYYSSVDRGNEAINDGVNLRLPSGTALDWGNRDYDVNLMVADKAWDAAGQLFFNIFNLDGFLGDQMTANLCWKPYFEVRARRYRFRILNASVSRYFRIALVREVNGTSGEFQGLPGSGLSYNRVPFYMIANDGNIMQHSVYFNSTSTGSFVTRRGILPTQGIGERYDIIVDFAQFPAGTKLYMVNLLEHQDGQKPNREISLSSILNGQYHNRSVAPADQPVVSSGKYQTDPCVTRFLQFRVMSYSGTDQSMNPAEFVEGNHLGPNGTDKKMIPLPGFTSTELNNALEREFEFNNESRDSVPWTIKTDGSRDGVGMDPRRLSAAPVLGAVEVWHLKNSRNDWSHPVHIHFEEGQILARGGSPPPAWEKFARKDIYRLGGEGDSTDSVDLAIRFREFLGSYMEHCHNTQHEDHSMLLRWDIENPGQFLVLPTPLPSWDGVSYVETYALPTFRTGSDGSHH
jgi:FtsP/CotA-like multicopper oxidase with cupredoxin domain